MVGNTLLTVVGVAVATTRSGRLGNMLVPKGGLMMMGALGVGALLETLGLGPDVVVVDVAPVPVVAVGLVPGMIRVGR